MTEEDMDKLFLPLQERIERLPSLLEEMFRVLNEMMDLTEKELKDDQ